VLSGACELRIELLANGALRRIDGVGVMFNLFVGNEVEGGLASLWLRQHGQAGIEAVQLLGPGSPLVLSVADPTHQARADWQGQWQGLQLRLQLRLALAQPAWFWHLQVHNTNAQARTLDVVLVHDLGLSAYGVTRLNEYYVSHYLDLSPLAHEQRGCLLAARQNLAVAGRHPWAVAGSLRRGVAFATDGLQVQGLSARTGGLPQGIAAGLPGTRLQHEHALLAIQDEALSLAPGATAELGFFVAMQADHPEATNAGDLAAVDAVLALPEAAPATVPASLPMPGPARTLFSTAPLLRTLDLSAAEIEALFGPPRRHEELDGATLLSFFHGENAHVVLRAKELAVQRPHGHILRTGLQLVPDETAMTSTVWMAGVFHSMVTQGHVGINRFLSTTRGWLAQFRSQGQRVFVRAEGGAWQQLGLPSAFEIEPDGCRWIYRHADGLLEVRCRAASAPHALGLQLRVRAGPALCVLVTHHVALGGDDGSQAQPLPVQVDAGGVFVGAPVGSEMALRFPAGGFRIQAEAGTSFVQVGGDEMLFEDGCPHGLPFVCVATALVTDFGLQLLGQLVDVPVTAGEPLPQMTQEQAQDPAPLPRWTLPADSALAREAAGLIDILPWYRHNALVHYLAPRGLEQFSGGGWGTRDVCQGPLEMLLALDRPVPVRDLLARVFAAQDVSGDWPQWFMFFERERHLRAGDSHGDIVFWPLLGLARYLLATADAALLEQPLPFYAAAGAAAEVASVWQHVQRALQLITQRRIAGTHLAAYGHGDWNDSLQPADPALRERLCSAWTVTLHHQMLQTLARALRALGREQEAAPLQAEAGAVLADFQRLLVPGGVVTGYALFPPGQPVEPLLHPQDRRTGVHFSLLPMMHAVLEDMLSPAQASEHLRIIDSHLSGPDGARLFDRPLAYRGGPEHLFQRAESSAFFGREIGVMYMHAHLRYAEMLAHLGLAGRFLEALCKAHPLGLRERVASASLRQANCYFSSSDAAFADRYEADREYARVAAGTVALDGGWRIYSSGPGIAIGLLVGHLLGLRREHATLVVDPVIPPGLDGLRVNLPLAGREVEISYHLGPAGCGPTRLALNGQPLPFTRGHNPYRTGAAEVAMAEWRARLVAGPNTLSVHTG
jgi:cellobiose phosphorylase